MATHFLISLQDVFGKWKFQTPGEKRYRAKTYCGSENDLGEHSFRIHLCLFMGVK